MSWAPTAWPVRPHSLKQCRKLAPQRIALPFQTVETVNESAADRDRMQDLFANGRPTEWRNRLIWGDKKYVLPSLLEEFAGKVNLIYIDPPFATGGDFSFTASVPADRKWRGRRWRELRETAERYRTEGVPRCMG